MSEKELLLEVLENRVSDMEVLLESVQSNLSTLVDVTTDMLSAQLKSVEALKILLEVAKQDASKEGS